MAGNADGSKGAVSSRLWIRGASPSHNFDLLCKELVKDLKVHTIMPESKADVGALSRLLAKIAYSFAVATHAGKPIASPLIGYATGGDTRDCLQYIGSRDDDESPAESLHDLNMVFDPASKLMVVRIRLLARLGTPTYYVVVQDTDERGNTAKQATSASSASRA